MQSCNGGETGPDIHQIEGNVVFLETEGRLADAIIDEGSPNPRKEGPPRVIPSAGGRDSTRQPVHLPGQPKTMVQGGLVRRPGPKPDPGRPSWAPEDNKPGRI
nr:unnamed protein product [Digitaria exilis]